MVNAGFKVMPKLVPYCEFAMSDQSFVAAKFTELDCAIHPRCDPGHVSVNAPLLTLNNRFVGVAATAATVSVPFVGLHTQVWLLPKAGRFRVSKLLVRLVAWNSVKLSPFWSAEPTLVTVKLPP